MITENRTSHPGAVEYKIEMLIKRGGLDSVVKCHIELRRMAKIIDNDAENITRAYMHSQFPISKIHDDLYAAGTGEPIADQEPVETHREVETDPATESALDTFAVKAGIVGGQGRTGGEMVASALYVLGGLALLAGVIVAIWVMSWGK